MSRPVHSLHDFAWLWLVLTPGCGPTPTPPGPRARTTLPTSAAVAPATVPPTATIGPTSQAAPKPPRQPKPPRAPKPPIDVPARASFYRSMQVGLMPYGGRVTWALSLEQRRLIVRCETAQDGLSLHPDQHTPDTWHLRSTIVLELVKRTDNAADKRFELSFEVRRRHDEPVPLDPTEAKRPTLCDQVEDSLRATCKPHAAKVRAQGAWVLEGQKASYGRPVRWTPNKLDARSGWGCQLATPISLAADALERQAVEDHLPSGGPQPHLFFVGETRAEGVELVDQKDGDLEARGYRAWTPDTGTGRFRYRYGVDR
ncbi:MAG: hypothetical protein AAGA56_05710 [Myxococcota bacterium]